MGDALSQFEVVEEAPCMPNTPMSPGSTNASRNGYIAEELGQINAAVDEDARLWETLPV